MVSRVSPLGPNSSWVSHIQLGTEAVAGTYSSHLHLVLLLNQEREN